MKDNHTWVICAYGESDYLEACIQSLKNQTLQSQIICYSSTPLDSIKELCQRYAIPFYTKQGGGIGKDWNLFPSSHFWRNRVMAFGNPICCPAVTYNLEKLKNFYFDEGMKVSLDWYAWYKISEYKGRFVYVSDKLMCHRIHEESETSKTIADNTRSKEDLYMYQLFWPKWIANILMKQYVKSQKTNG